MKCLHYNGVIYWDLKPADILMNNWMCKINDFGFASNLDKESVAMKNFVERCSFCRLQRNSTGKTP